MLLPLDQVLQVPLLVAGLLQLPLKGAQLLDVPRLGSGYIALQGGALLLKADARFHVNVAASRVVVCRLFLLSIEVLIVHHVCRGMLQPA